MTYNIHWTCRAFLSAMPFSQFSTNQNKQCVIRIFAFAVQWAPTVSSFQRAAELLPFPIPSCYAPLVMTTIHHYHCNMAHQSVSCQFFGRSWCLQAELYYHFFLLSFLAACHWHRQKLGGREIQNFFSKYMLTSQVHYISQDEQKNSSKNWQRENRKCFIFVLFFSWRYTRHITQ